MIMKHVNILVLIIIWLACLATKCQRESDKCHKTIAFVNNSPKEVYIHGGWYPDTLGFNKLFPNPYKQPNLYKVTSNEKNTLGLGRRDCLESSVTQGIMTVYVFDAEVLETIPWDSVGKYYMVLKTIRPTIDEMQSNNWTIYYNGEY